MSWKYYGLLCYSLSLSKCLLHMKQFVTQIRDKKQLQAAIGRHFLGNFIMHLQAVM